MQKSYDIKKSFKKQAHCRLANLCASKSMQNIQKFPAKFL